MELSLVEVRALISFVAIATDERLRRDHLKLCCLWYDEVLVERGRFRGPRKFLERLIGDVSRRDFHDISDIIVPLEERVSEEITGTRTSRVGDGYPRWGAYRENYDYPDPKDPLEFAHNRLLRSIETEHGVTKFDVLDAHYAEGRARVAVDSVALWDRVNRYLPCTLQCTADEKVAIEAADSFQATARETTSSERLFEALIPSLEGVNWTEIARLRRQGGFRSLRSKINQAFALGGQDIDNAKKLFSTFEEETATAIIDGARPKVRKVALEAVLGNLPGFPVFNPFGLFFGSRDTGQAIKDSRQRSWFYLLRDVRGLAGRERPISVGKGERPLT